MNRKPSFGTSVFALVVVALGAVMMTGCLPPFVDETPQGRCWTNDDCSKGTTCVDRWCEDIYHPRDTIKNY